MSRSVPLNEIMKKRLQDPEFVKIYLDESLHDNDPKAFLIAMRRVKRPIVFGCGTPEHDMPIVARGSYGQIDPPPQQFHDVARFFFAFPGKGERPNEAEDAGRRARIEISRERGLSNLMLLPQCHPALGFGRNRNLTRKFRG